MARAASGAVGAVIATALAAVLGASVADGQPAGGSAVGAGGEARQGDRAGDGDRAAMVGRLLDELKDERLATRMTAAQRLASDPGLRLRDLEPWLERGDLTAEQRLRLWNAAQRRFAVEPRAALGITADPMPQQSVTLLEVRADFPASGVLRPGDRVMVIDGVRIANMEDLRRAVIARDPGDVVRLRVIRNGETVDLDVPLGRYGGPNFAPVESYLPLAWTHRSRSYVPLEGARGGRVEVSLAAGSGMGPGLDLAEDGTLALAEGAGGVEVQVGGEPPPAELGRWRFNRLEVGGEEAARQVEMALMGQRATLDRLGLAMEAMRRELQNPALAPDRRALLTEQLRMFEQRWRVVAQEVAELERALARMERGQPPPRGPRVLPAR